MIEIIATTLEDVIRIEKFGGNRIELISAFSEGGLTPSYALIEEAVKRVRIPINVMIRPHSKSFTYSQDEIEMMKKDILIAKSLNVNGVVFGVLNEKNEICKKALENLLQVCDGLDVTFHRAIVEVPDQIAAMKILSKYTQITNVLTSGGKGNILDNIDNLKAIKENSRHINVLVGGGLNFHNINEIKDKVRAAQYHFGTAVRENSSFSGEIDGEKLNKMANIVNLKYSDDIHCLV